MMTSIDKTRVPRHVAIIMDGNGRWAQAQSLPRAKGHIEGVRRVEEMIDAARDMGIKVITLFTFSTENWGRPENEVTVIMNILATVLEKKLQKLRNDNIQLRIIGRKDRVPGPLWETIEKVIHETSRNTGLIVNLAFNYGSRLEILDAVRSIAASVQLGQIALDQITEDTMSQSLYTKDLPDPDLLIRTSGEQRISNFLLWQLSYAELYFTETLWPDFDTREFTKAILDFQGRERRYGKLAIQEGEK